MGKETSSRKAKLNNCRSSQFLKNRKTPGRPHSLKLRRPSWSTTWDGMEAAAVRQHMVTLYPYGYCNRINTISLPAFHGRPTHNTCQARWWVVGVCAILCRL
ncbi:hypothetical protein B0T26DRAFT_97551 [Lasiosphaeria miniovina]|uniref:Uncharacterized protein n=1 Tax=Lasiosphaeria miniovina TaxID=1954250 RepID=A0AA40BJ63_9PEZI|nr:uncharacterized protein B0T26DRAFT_97551 [Lasiosphaeria miniovina]KAK0735175.1 hypothetical protein B0T26DRAFT_97551 [Lasiosphaeria miniovina]